MNLWTGNGEQITVSDGTKTLNIGVLGDSISAGVGASSGNGWVDLISNDFASIRNYARSGTKIAPDFCTMYATMSDDLDVVIVYGGTNDWYHGTSFGNADSTDDASFYGALNVLMQGLLTKYVGKEIFFVTPMSSEYQGKNTDNTNNASKTMLDYRNAIIERCAHYAIPYIDLYAECGMDVAHNDAHMEYFSDDGVHPNDAGHRRVYERILHRVKTVLGQ